MAGSLRILSKPGGQSCKFVVGFLGSSTLIDIFYESVTKMYKFPYNIYIY